MWPWSTHFSDFCLGSDPTKRKRRATREKKYMFPLPKVYIDVSVNFQNFLHPSKPKVSDWGEHISGVLSISHILASWVSFLFCEIVWTHSAGGHRCFYLGSYSEGIFVSRSTASGQCPRSYPCPLAAVGYKCSEEDKRERGLHPGMLYKKGYFQMIQNPVDRVEIDLMRQDKRERGERHQEKQIEVGGWCPSN